MQLNSSKASKSTNATTRKFLFTAVIKSKINNYLIIVFIHRFLGSAGPHQPDLLISAETAILIVLASQNDSQDFKQTRMKVLSTSFKCTKCCIIVVAPDMITTSKLPSIWYSLYGLSLFYEKKNQKGMETPFQLKLHLAVNYNQAAFIMQDIILDELDGKVGDIQPQLQPTCDQAKLMLHFSHFNAVSAQLLAEHITAADLLYLDEETLASRIPSQELRDKIKVSLLFSRYFKFIPRLLFYD